RCVRMEISRIEVERRGAYLYNQYIAYSCYISVSLQGGTIMIAISEQASSRIKDMLASEEAQNQQLFLRVSVKEGGCSGFSYGMGFDDDQVEDDQVLDIRGLKVVVDKNSSKYLYGVEIDYK